MFWLVIMWHHTDRYCPVSESVCWSMWHHTDRYCPVSESVCWSRRYHTDRYCPVSESVCWSMWHHTDRYCPVSESVCWSRRYPSVRSKERCRNYQQLNYCLVVLFCLMLLSNGDLIKPNNICSWCTMTTLKIPLTTVVSLNPTHGSLYHYVSEWVIVV